jgi:hypothetical protein
MYRVFHIDLTEEIKRVPVDGGRAMCDVHKKHSALVQRRWVIGECGRKRLHLVCIHPCI